MLFTFKISIRRVRENIYIENINRTVTWKLLLWEYEQDGSVKTFTLKILTGWLCENFYIGNMNRMVLWKLLHWKIEKDGSVSSLRNTCLPLHHRPGDPAVGGWVTLTDGVIWKFDELWCNSVTQSRRFATNKFGWLLKMIFLNLKVGAMELMVLMFNPTHLRQVDLFAHFQKLWPRRKLLVLLLKFWPMEKYAEDSQSSVTQGFGDSAEILFVIIAIGE